MKQGGEDILADRRAGGRTNQRQEVLADLKITQMNNVESLVGDEGATTNAAGTPTLYSDNPGKKYVIAEKGVSYALWQM